MIISRTPFRVSFVGGGTDLSRFYHEHSGAVVSKAVSARRGMTPEAVSRSLLNH